ncbi:MAG: hypothetical protein NC098_05485 [Lachnoclostridium sp.]|nr:hypothetical protein [Lachnoclostridium sp.]
MQPHQATSETKWSEIEHLPEWDEEYYHVYTAKKYGKWLMLKTLRPEYKDKPEFREMIEKEFDVRYNLAHPNIIMINDFEEVPGLGRCIITDDVYGKSLARLIADGEVKPSHVEKLRTQLIGAIEYILTNHLVHHPITPERIIYTDKIENLKLIDVGFDQMSHLSPAEASEDIKSYGEVILKAIDALPEEEQDQFASLRQVALRCTDPEPRRRYPDIAALRLALAERRTNNIYIAIIIFLVAMIGLMLWFNSSSRPETPVQIESTK